MTLNVYFETNIVFVQNITLRAPITCKALEDHVLYPSRKALASKASRKALASKASRKALANKASRKHVSKR